MSTRRHTAAGVITARRGRALFEIDPETQARTVLDPAALDVALQSARANRRRLYAQRGPRPTQTTCLADWLLGPRKTTEETA